MSINIVGDFLLERSQSRSRKHLSSSILLIYKKGQGLIKLNPEIIAEEKPASPTYVKGEAKLVKIRLEHGDFVIYGWFVRNYLNKVKGYISVHNYKGVLVFESRYNNGVLTRTFGDPVYSWLVRVFAETLRINVSKTRLGDEK